MQKVQSKSEAERAKAREEAAVELDMTQAMVVSEKPKSKKGEAKESGMVEVDAAYAPSDDEGSETDEKGPMAFKQRELVAMAFAGDNVVEVSDPVGILCTVSEWFGVGFLCRETASYR